jgi:hypothetical protein
VRAPLVLALLAAIASDAAADNPDLDRARTLKGELRYREAAAALDAAIRRGGATPARLASMWRLAGELAGGLDHREPAVDHFARALAIDPSTALDLGASPKLTAPFDAALDRLAGRRLELRPTVDGRRVRLEVSDPLAMIREVRIERAGGEIVASRAAPPYEVTLAGDAAVELVAIALDEHGNRLTQTAPLEVSAAVEEPPPGNDRSIWRGPLPWLGGAALAGVAGATFGVLTLSAQSDLDELSDRARAEPFSVTFEELEDTRRHGRRRALIANVSFAVAGVAAIGAGVAWWLGGRSDRIEPAPGGVAVRF